MACSSGAAPDSAIKYEYLLGHDEADPSVMLDDRALPWQTSTTLPSFGFTEQSAWVRMHLPPVRYERLLTIVNPLLDHVYVLIEANSISGTHRVRSAYDLGTRVPYKVRPLRADPNFTFNVPASSAPVRVLIRADIDGLLTLPIRVLDREGYRVQITESMFIRGGYYGVIAMMLIYNVGLGLALRERSYGFYALTCTSTIFIMCSLDGMGFQFLWGDFISWQQNATSVAVGLAVSFLAWFARDFLNLQTSKHWMGDSLLAIGWLGIAHAVFNMSFSGRLSHIVEMVGASVVTVLLIGFGLWRARTGYVPALYFCAAVAVAAAGSAVFLLRGMGWLPQNPFTQHATQLGMALEMAVLSFAMAARIRIERTERERATANAQALNIRLEELQRERELSGRERELQRSMQHSQQLQVLGQMAAGFAHGFNNILTSIIGFAEIALERANELRDEPLRRGLTEIHKGGHRAAELVDQLLTYGGGVRRVNSRTSINDAIERALIILRPILGGHRLEWRPAREDVSVIIDPDQLQQAIINLCLYVRDAMSEPGTIAIEVRPRQDVSDTCTSCLADFDGSYHLMRITDSGSVLEGELSQLFTPFYTARPGEMPSLGLAVVHGIVHEYGGHVLVDPNDDRGTEFRIYFPAAAGTPA